MSFPYEQDTIVAQSTPVGEGAIGVIRLSGSESINILRKIFRHQSGKSLGTSDQQQIISHHFYLGHLIYPQTEEIIDQVMTVWMKGPKSFTGEDVVEIHGHGSPVLLNQIISLIMELGARLAEPGEFSKRAYLNGKIDLSQAEALADLIASKNERASKNALKQLDGYLARTINQLKEKIINILAQVEAGFDFVEDDVQVFQKDQGLQTLSGIMDQIKELLDSFHTGQIYKEGLRVAIVGKPNVGKSSLLNRIIKQDRAIIHHDPGTTRDIVEGERKIHGIQTVFCDTAGIRDADHGVEQEGIKRSKQIFKKADLVLLLLDVSQPLSIEDQQLLEHDSGPRLILVLNKVDLEPQWESDKKMTDKAPLVKISAKKGDGIDGLLETIYNVIIKEEIAKDHGFVLNNSRHKKVLEKVKEQLFDIIQQLGSNHLSEECLAEELRTISKNLSQITGGIDNEEVLDEIFLRFCVGK